MKNEGHDYSLKNIPRDIWNKLKRTALKEDRSIRSMIVLILRDYLKREKG